MGAVDGGSTLCPYERTSESKQEERAADRARRASPVSCSLAGFGGMAMVGGERRSGRRSLRALRYALGRALRLRYALPSAPL